MTLLKNIASADAECPPEDTYTWELIEIGDFQEQESSGFRPTDPDVINTQSRFVWQMVDFDYDPDEDEKDWNGLEVYTYVTFFRRLVGEPEEKNKSIFKSDRSVAHQVLSALGFDVDANQDMELNDKLGWRVKATCKPKASGWPKLEGFSKTRQKRAKRVEPTEPDPFEDEDTA